MSEMLNIFSARNAGQIWPTYQGLVATRCKVPTSFTAATKAVMSRTAHVAREDLSTFKIRMGNWWTQSASVPDQAPSGTTTFTVALEWPLGTTYTRATYQGANFGSISGLGYLDFDIAAPSTMPRGSLFRVRVYATNPNGTLSHGYQSNILGDAAGFYTTIDSATQDLTLGGSMGPAGAAWGPLAIIGPTKRSSVLIFGDSIAEGAVEDTTSDEDPDVGIVARWIGPNFAYSNVSQGGSALNSVMARSLQRMTQVGAVTDVITNLMNNDLSSGFAWGPTTKNNLAIFLAAIRANAGPQGVRIWYTTCTPLPVTSTDSFVTTANQTIHANAAVRVSFNSDLRAGMVPGVDGYFDVADYVEDVRNNGKFFVNGVANATVAADGVHMTGLMYRRVQDGLVTAARQQLGR